MVTSPSCWAFPTLSWRSTRWIWLSFKEDVFERIKNEYESFFKNLTDSNPARPSHKDLIFIPISALKGDNVTVKSSATLWYKGPSLLECLETIEISKDRNLDDFRFPVQTVLRPNLDYRGFAGKVESGIVKKGDKVMVLPSGGASTVKAIDTYDGEVDEAFPPMCVNIRLEK